MLIEATYLLIATARDKGATAADMNAAAQSFFDAVRDVSRDEANAAIGELSGHFDLEDRSRGAFLATICGALVERGCDPTAMAKPLLEQISFLLESSAELAVACNNQIPDTEDEDDDEDDDEDSIDRFNQAREGLKSIMVQQDAAWDALEQFWCPAIALFSRSPEARAAAADLRVFASQIAEYHEGGHWLELMLGVLDNEPLVAIEPSTGLGILGRISGVVDNFQLNVLLMDSFPKSEPLAQRRVPQAVADVAHGSGPQQSEHTVTSVWNLYHWTAIEAGMSLPDPTNYDSSEHWIWNEGTPADISVFDGGRVVLLGPASYPRSWQSQRMFADLPAKLDVERTLTEVEVRD